MRWSRIRHNVALLVGVVALALAGCAPNLPFTAGSMRTPGTAATETAQATSTPALPGRADVSFKESKEIRGGVWGMIAGADGAVWFTTGSAVNRMTTDGAIRSFPMRGYPENLLVGPDKNVWFIERSTSSLPYRVARITSSGALRDYPLPNYQRIFTPNLVAGADGALWGIMSGIPLVNGSAFEVTASLIRITMKGAITTYPLPANFGPSEFGEVSILARAGGGAWVSVERESVASEPNHVFHLTPVAAYLGMATSSGRLSRISLPKGTVTAPTLTGVDATGALWAVAGSGATAELFSVSLAGVMTKIASSGALSGFPQAAVFDSRGALWYTGGYAGGGQAQLHSITPTGVVTEYSYGNGPSVSQFPYDAHVADQVIVGPDGNIWFTERISDYIGRITLGGSLTEFRLPSPAHRISLLGALVVGPDNNLWYVRNYYDSADGAPVSGVIGRLIL